MLSPATEQLGTDDVHVWRASLVVAPEDLRRLGSSLSAEERLRSERLLQAGARRRFVTARGIVRRVLAAYLNETPDLVRFSYGPMGQPRLAEQPDGLDLRFNLSHSRDLLLLAIARARAVGVDLEPVRQLAHREAIERRVFSADEQQSLANLPADLRLYAFFQGWTRKEAFAKALGDGMWATMGRVEVSLDPSATPRLVCLDGDREAAAGWSLYHLEPAPGFVGAVAVEGQGLNLSERSMKSEAAP